MTESGHITGDVDIIGDSWVWMDVLALTCSLYSSRPPWNMAVEINRKGTNSGVGEKMYEDLQRPGDITVRHSVENAVQIQNVEHKGTSTQKNGRFFTLLARFVKDHP